MTWYMKIGNCHVCIHVLSHIIHLAGTQEQQNWDGFTATKKSLCKNFDDVSFWGSFDVLALIQRSHV